MLSLLLLLYPLQIPDCNVARSILLVLPQEDAVPRWVVQVERLLLHLLTSLPTDPTAMVFFPVPLLHLGLDSEEEEEEEEEEEGLELFRCVLSPNPRQTCWARTLG